MDDDRPRHSLRPAPGRKSRWSNWSSPACTGGKFDKGKGGAYSFSGGLHGVGVSVTNALGKRLEATSYREGQVARIVFRAATWSSRCRCAKWARASDRKSGTTVRVWPDAKYFESASAAHGRTGAPAAQQGGAHARRVGHAGNEKQATPRPGSTKGGLTDYLAQTLTADP